MTSDTKDPYDLVLADLIAQRDKLNAAIDAIQAIRGGAPSVTSETAGHVMLDFVPVMLYCPSCIPDARGEQQGGASADLLPHQARLRR
jgi:hypothetical protein